VVAMSAAGDRKGKEEEGGWAQSASVRIRAFRHQFSFRLAPLRTSWFYYYLFFLVFFFRFTT
jgi:hypothetical protein